MTYDDATVRLNRECTRVVARCAAVVESEIHRAAGIQAHDPSLDTGDGGKKASYIYFSVRPVTRDRIKDAVGVRIEARIEASVGVQACNSVPVSCAHHREVSADDDLVVRLKADCANLTVWNGGNTPVVTAG